MDKHFLVPGSDIFYQRAVGTPRVVQRGGRTNVGDQLMETMKQSKGDEHAER